MNIKKILILGLILAIFSGGILFFRLFPQLEFLEVGIAPPEIVKLAEKKAEVFSPSPLLFAEREEVPLAVLTQQGVIEETNIQRQSFGPPVFRENPKLNAMALAKAEDMFQNQYFSHDSPSGEGVGDLAKDFGYDFLVIGENLAMGNFANDKDLLEAWMQSPGHRENILNPAYQEIGVAVKKGVFDGKLIWVAVQHFGSPVSACPQPDSLLLVEINENQKQILELQNELFALVAEIRQIRPRREESYAQKVEQYNDLVFQHDALSKKQEALIKQYNSQIDLFNQCFQTLTR